VYLKHLFHIIAAVEIASPPIEGAEEPPERVSVEIPIHDRDHLLKVLRWQTTVGAFTAASLTSTNDGSRVGPRRPDSATKEWQVVSREQLVSIERDRAKREDDEKRAEAEGASGTAHFLVCSRCRTKKGKGGYSKRAWKKVYRSVSQGGEGSGAATVCLKCRAKEQ
jgi:hypothetical protein